MKKWCWLQLYIVRHRKEKEKGYGPGTAKVAFAFSKTSPPADSYWNYQIKCGVEKAFSYGSLGVKCGLIFSLIKLLWSEESGRYGGRWTFCKWAQLKASKCVWASQCDSSLWTAVTFKYALLRRLRPLRLGFPQLRFAWWEIFLSVSPLVAGAVPCARGEAPH